VTLTSISAYETTNGYSRGDIDGGVAGTGPGFIPFDSDTRDGIDDLDQYTQEIRLASDTDGPFTWQVGGYYFKSDFLVTTDAGFNKATLNHKNTAWAAFGQAAYQVTPALKITGGLRWTDDNKSMTVVGSTAPEGLGLGQQGLVGPVGLLHRGRRLQPLRPRRPRLPRPDHPGPRRRVLRPASVAQSETIQSYEVGFKSELLDRRVRFNGAAFTYEEKNPQFSAIGGAANGTLLVNADKGEAYGVEFDGEFQVTENLLLTAGYSYNHTKIKDKDLAGGGLRPVHGDRSEERGRPGPVDGNPFPNAPKYVLNFTARYSYPVGDGELFAYTDWFRQGYTNIFLYQSKEFYSKGDFEGGLKLGYAKAGRQLRDRRVRPQHHQRGEPARRHRLQQPDRFRQRASDRRHLDQRQAVIRKTPPGLRAGRIARRIAIVPPCSRFAPGAWFVSEGLPLHHTMR
jgi:iron complex outermembrane receptor protein